MRNKLFQSRGEDIMDEEDKKDKEAKKAKEAKEDKDEIKDKKVKETARQYERIERYTYEDYCAWDDDQRWELIDGIAYAMSAPTWQHQDISRSLLVQLSNFLEGKPCKVFHAPFDVRLNADTYDNTVVQPDLIVICDRVKLSRTGCAGAPDMVVEILSPSTAGHDMIRKYHKYLQAGVREFWIVDPATKVVRVCLLKDKKYEQIDYLDADIVPVQVLEGCKIDFKKVFADLDDEPDGD